MLLHNSSTTPHPSLHKTAVTFLSFPPATVVPVCVALVCGILDPLKCVRVVNLALVQESRGNQSKT